MVLTKQDVVDWKNNAVTKRYFKGLEDSRKEILEFIAVGGCKQPTIDETAQELAGELGKIKAIDSILNFTVEDLLEEAMSLKEDDE